MSAHPQLLYLTDVDVTALDLDVRSVRQAIKDTFRLYAVKKVRCEPKSSIFLDEGHAFQSLAAVDTERGCAALKWVGMVPRGGATAVNINASILLSDAPSGQLRCLMDARHATALRTAGMTAVAADFLASKDSEAIGFVGAGIQAEGHLAALADLLPFLRNVYVNSGPGPISAGFAERCRALGFEPIEKSVREVVSQSDVVVTTVPLRRNFEPFIDAAWIRPGAFVAAIDLGRPWIHAGLKQLDLTVVDEETMKHYAKPGNFVPSLDHAGATLVDLVGGRHKGRKGPQERVMLFSSGSAVADLAIAMLIHERALAKGIGMPLPQ
ncbi:ornithine cyclodeaminase family protein [Ensifer sp. 4252]|uniref:ornithine cyclodeaminase family protein n=1 Tax=Ensifer sp. 4252 TaxID=3373915 RepID=UPI003D25A152